MISRCVGGQGPPLRLNVCKSFTTVRRGRRTLRYNIYHQRKLGGAVRNNEQTSCATRVSSRGPSLALRAIHLVSRLRRVNRMCSSTVSVNCEHFTKDTVE